MKKTSSCALLGAAMSNAQNHSNFTAMTITASAIHMTCERILESSVFEYR